MSNEFKKAQPVDVLSAAEMLSRGVSVVSNVLSQTEARRANPSSAAFFQASASQKPTDQPVFDKAQELVDDLQRVISNVIGVLSAPTHAAKNVK